MSASYPLSIKAFTSRVAGDTIQPAHVNDLQDEVTALETDLLKAWLTPAFVAGNFTASGSMTWGVDAGDVTTFAYHKIGTRMTVAFQIDNTDLGGTASNELLALIPGGFTAAKSVSALCKITDAGGTPTAGFVYVAASGTTINFRKIDDANWTLTAGDNTSVVGQITFETTT